MIHKLTIEHQLDLPPGFEPEVLYKMLRVKCPLTYPDGSNIDVFLIPGRNDWIVTDNGNTDTWCFHVMNGETDDAVYKQAASRLVEFDVNFHLVFDRNIQVTTDNRNEDILYGIYRVMLAAHYLSRFKEHGQAKTS